MIRRVIQIDEEKCNGCGICVTACHEGAIGMVDGKARLMRDDYCDGLGDCLPNCPTGAISFIEREAAAYDEAAVKANMERKETHKADQLHSAVHRCPGQAIREFNRRGFWQFLSIVVYFDFFPRQILNMQLLCLDILHRWMIYMITLQNRKHKRKHLENVHFLYNA